MVIFYFYFFQIPKFRFIYYFQIILGIVSTIAGNINYNIGYVDGIGTNARFGSGIKDLYFDSNSNSLWIADYDNAAIRSLNLNSKNYFLLLKNLVVFLGNNKLIQNNKI